MVEGQWVGRLVFEKCYAARVACISHPEFAVFEQSNVGSTAAAVGQREFDQSVGLGVVQFRMLADDVFVGLKLRHFALLFQHYVFNFYRTVN